MLQAKYFLLQKEPGSQGFTEQINASFPTKSDPKVVFNENYFDTFDWRLHNSNHYLTKNNNKYALYKTGFSQPVCVETIRGRARFKFWWDLPEGALKKLLKPILGVRSLISFLSLEGLTKTLHVLNNDRKTVVRVKVHDFNTVAPNSDKADITIIELDPVRGYKKEFTRLSEFLTAMGLQATNKKPYEIVCRELDVLPGSYSSKITAKLDPHTSASVGSKRILSGLLDTMQQNEYGITKDLDTEFLHDFRVSVRRTRSLLSQVKGVFPPEVTDRFKEDFAYLGKMTNELRDLDVYLLKENEYKAMLPTDISSLLDPLFDQLKSRRKAVLKSTVKSLHSERYKKIIHAWQQFLDEPFSSPHDAPHANSPIIEVARDRIWKRFRNIMKAGSKITLRSPDEELHRLRINCKKLRYLLEFFSSLFPNSDIVYLIKQLKRLQDNLGDFNDLYMQQTQLRNYIDRSGVEQGKTMMAVGGLISALYQKQHRVRAEFSDRFAEFSSAKNKALFKRLFAC